MATTAELATWFATNRGRSLKCLALALGVPHHELLRRLGVQRSAQLRIVVPRPPAPSRRPRGRPRREVDRQALLQALRVHDGCVRRVASALCLPRSTAARHAATLPRHAWTYGTRIREAHGMLLGGSGVTPAVAHSRGYRSVAHGLRIPVWNVDGSSPWFQDRLDVPTKAGGRRKQRYRNARGATPIVDVPPAGRHLAVDRSRRLFVTESPRKADSAVSHGLACVDIVGALLVCEDPDQWNAIGVAGRDVVIALDSDAATNPDVAAAEARLLCILRSLGARVSVARLQGDKIGLDDFLAAGRDPSELTIVGAED